MKVILCSAYFLIHNQKPSILISARFVKVWEMMKEHGLLSMLVDRSV